MRPVFFSWLTSRTFTKLQRSDRFPFVVLYSVCRNTPPPIAGPLLQLLQLKQRTRANPLSDVIIPGNLRSIPVMGCTAVDGKRQRLMRHGPFLKASAPRKYSTDPRFPCKSLHRPLPQTAPYTHPPFPHSACPLTASSAGTWRDSCLIPLRPSELFLISLVVP